MTSFRGRVVRRPAVLALGVVGLMAAWGVAVAGPAFGPAAALNGNAASDTGMDAAPTPEETAGPLRLSDDSAAAAAVRCQQAVGKETARLVRTRFRALAKCEKRFQKCVQLRPDDGTCLDGAADRCQRALAKIGSEEPRRTSSIIKRCPESVLRPGDLLGAEGLGFGLLASECEQRFGIVPDEMASIIACVLRQHACHVERMVDVFAPRTKELLRLPPGGGIAVDTLPCLPDHGGVGEALDPVRGAALARCATALAKVGAGFVRRGLARHAKCVGAVFRCVQLVPDDGRCMEKATATCDKRLGDAGRDVERLAQAVASRCGATRILYEDLRLPRGAYLEAVEEVCTALGLPLPTSLDGYRSCLIRHEICRTAELVRFAIPRADDLLARVGRTLGESYCPATLALEAHAD